MRVLLAQPNEAVDHGVTTFLRLQAASVDAVGSAVAATAALTRQHFDVLVLDLALSETACCRLLELNTQSTMPAVIILASSERAEVGLRLAFLGARAVIHKPVNLAAFARAWQEATSRAPDLRPLLRTSVGLIGMRSMEAMVRADMTREALARSRGSRRGAATILQISRQLLQHILRNDEPICRAVSGSSRTR